MARWWWAKQTKVIACPVTAVTDSGGFAWPLRRRHLRVSAVSSVQWRLGLVGVSIPARPREKQQEREEYYQNGHCHHESSHTFFACNHVGRLDAVGMFNLSAKI